MIAPGLFRLVLATVVVLSHFTKLGIGTAAVNLFFVLSGFWIYRMFRDRYMLAAYPYVLFVASRLMRLLPIFLLFNTLAIILHNALGDEIAKTLRPFDIFPNVLLVGYASLLKRPLVPAWSLDIEMQFYLAFPFIFPFVKAIDRYALGILLVIVAAGGTYVCLYQDDDHCRFVLPYMGFFLFGSLSARLPWKPSNRLAWTSALISATLLVSLAAIPALQGVLIPGIDRAEFAWNPTLNFLLGILLAPFALSSVYRRSTRTDRLYGDMSYVVYCSHWLAVVVAAHYLAGVGRITKAPLVVALVIVTYLVSLIVLLYIDRPISRWRERWVDRRLLPSVS